MSMILCKECATAVSTAAKACPRCGAPVPAKTKKLHLVFAGVILLVIGLSIYDKSGRSPEPAVEKVYRPGAKEVFVAEMLVKSSLKDPDSAVFGQTHFRDGFVCGSVNAKNSFGAKTGFMRFVVNTKSPSVDIEGSSTRLPGLWDSHCR